jgi:hypothetical protein
MNSKYRLQPTAVLQKKLDFYILWEDSLTVEAAVFFFYNNKMTKIE